MRARSRQRWVGPAGAVAFGIMVVAPCQAAPAVEPGHVLFYAPFDGTTSAEIARGNASARSVKGQETYEQGRKGRALVCGGMFVERCSYDLKDNLHLDEGSIEVLLKAVDWEWGDKQHHVFFETSARNGARLLLYKPCHSDKIHFHVWRNQKTPFGVSAKSAVAKGVWHHVAATWRRGEIALYIDGQRVDRDARAQVIMPEIVGPTFTLGDKRWGKAREGMGKTLLDEFSIYGKPLSAGEVAKRYGALSAVKNMITVAMAQQPPKVDGHMSPGEWDTAACITGFISNATGALAERQTRVFLSYDTKKLYVAFRSVVKPGTTLVADCKSHDGPIWRDDAIELFLAPSRGTEQKEPLYFHFSGNSAGICLEGKGTNNQWEAGWDYACTVNREVNAIGAWSTWWTAEAAIPFSQLGVPAPRDGESWRANFCRDWQSPHEYTAWSPAPSFHDTDTFGCLTFVGKGSVVRLHSLGKLSQGRLDLKAEVSSPAQGEAVELVGRVLVRGAGETQLEKRIPIHVKPGGSEPVSYAHELTGQSDHLLFSVATPDRSRTFLRSSVPFGKLDIDAHLAKIVLLPLSKGTGQIAVDVGVFPQRIKQPRAVVSLVPAGRAKPLQTVTIERFDGSIGQGRFSLKNLAPGSYKVIVSVRDGQKQVYEKVLAFTKPDTPWLGSSAGVTDEVLPPWTPMGLKGTTVKCWGREYHLDAGVLPSRIVTRGAQILQSPICLEVTFTDGASHRINPALKTVDRNRSGSKVSFTGAARCGSLDFAAKGYIEFDGMMFLEIGVTPRSPTKVARLRLVAPLQGRHVTLKHMFGHAVKKGVSSVGRTEGWQWHASSYRKCIWLGDGDLGLTWFMEHPVPWALKRGAEFTGVSRRGAVVRWHFNFIDSPTTISEAKTIAFGLQATPVKPLPSRWRSWGIERRGCGTTLWSRTSTAKYWGYPESPNPERTRAQVRGFHEQGLMVAPYVGTQAMDEQCPEFQYYGAEWLVPGGNRPLSRAGGFRTRHPSVCTGSKAYRDFLTYKIKQFVKALDLDGIYHDHSRPWRCTNTHHGCANSRRILAMRDLYKRIYTILRQHTRGKQTFMVEHILESLCTPVVSFSDAYVMCEVLRLDEHNDYLKVVDLDYFRSYCMGRQFGFVPMLLTGFRSKERYYLKGKPNRELTDGTEKLAAILLLLDMTTVWNSYNDPRIIRRIWQVFDDYRISTDDAVEFLPYWSNAKYVTAAFRQKPEAGEEYPEPLVSIYNRRGKCALVAVANFTLKDRDVRVKLDLDSLGFRRVKAVDAYYEPPLLILNTPNHSASSIKLDNPYKTVPVRLARGTMVLPVKARRFRLIGIKHVGGYLPH